MAGDVALLLKTLVEDALGTGDVFISKEIEGGARWTHEIPKQLNECGDGLVVVTTENHVAPWLHFEAGALSKQIDASYVTPLLFDAEIGEIQGTPLALFQAKRIDQDDLRQLMVEMGSRRGKEEAGIRRRFNHAWEDFESAISGLRKTATKTKRRLNNDDLGAMIESLTAQISRIARPEKSVAAAIAGQGRLATASVAEAAALISPYIQNRTQSRGSFAHYSALEAANAAIAANAAHAAHAAASSRDAEMDGLLASTLRHTFQDGQKVHHGSFGFGTIERLSNNYATVQFDDGETHKVLLSELR